MKTMKKILAGLILTLGAGSAVAGPDFTGPAAKAKPLAASAEATKMILPEDDVVFLNDSAALLDSGIQQITRVAKWMKRHPSMRLIVEGHANSLGTASHNADLATARADMVRMHLIGHGIASNRIIIVVYGETEADAKPNSVDRRVVLAATKEAPAVVSRRLMRSQRALSVTYTNDRGKNPTLITETHGTITEQVATR
jgi:outer membrane protein OmpA-like peptidoglycan-associated protein